MWYLKAEKYDPHPRQVYDNNPIENMSYKDFIELASNPRIYKPDKGGQRRKITARNKTLEYCETVYAGHINGKISEKSLERSKFEEMVKEAMVNIEGSDEMYLVSAVRDDFWFDQRMKPYRRPVGRPSKKIK